MGAGGGGAGRPAAAGGDAVRAAVRGAGGHRRHLVALLARHHPQELQPVRGQRVRGRHQPVPDGARLPLPARAGRQAAVARRRPGPHRSAGVTRRGLTRENFTNGSVKYEYEKSGSCVSRIITRRIV